MNWIIIIIIIIQIYVINPVFNSENPFSVAIESKVFENKLIRKQKSQHANPLRFILLRVLVDID